jgi:Na+/phosphate symporter
MNLADGRMLAAALKARAETGSLGQLQFKREVLYLADVVEQLLHRDYSSSTKLAVARSLALLDRPHQALEQIERAVWHYSARDRGESDL